MTMFIHDYYDRICFKRILEKAYSGSCVLCMQKMVLAAIDHSAWAFCLVTKL